MTYPVYIHTPLDLHEHVKLNETPESRVLEFKIKLDRHDDWQTETAEDVCQFANELGGCLLFGVAERQDPATGLKVASAFKGIENADQVRGDIEQAITNRVVPSTLSKTIDMLTVDSKSIIAVNVPPSRRLVYVWDRSTGNIRCPYRTNHGKARMNPDEMERHMMNGSRAARIALLDARKVASRKDCITLMGGVWQLMHGGRLRHVQGTFQADITDDSHEDWFRILGRGHLTPYPINIPFDVVRSIWVDTDGAVVALLSVRLMLGEDGKSLVLDPSLPA